MRSQTSLASSYATAYGSTSPASQRSMMGGSPSSQSSQRTLKRVPVPRFSVLERRVQEDGGGGSRDGESLAESPLSLSLFPEPPTTGTPGAVVVGGGVDPFQDPRVESTAVEVLRHPAPLSVKKKSMMPTGAPHVAPLVPAKERHSKRYSTSGSIRPPQQRPAKSSSHPTMTAARGTSDPFLNQALVEASPPAPPEDEVDLGVTNPFGDQFKAADQDTKEMSGRPVSATLSVRNGRYSALAKLAVPERREGRPASRASTTSVGSNYVWGQAM
ncbi:hypothetical protein DFP72DRAFT_576416 [Ephemerocybe angulata]|uniref:Uncharacterized protein n=1 Tax=Ephemerocybe angulata TaxID=980116 RepID=A0A8H6LZ98_9AGAR|nr:hypothetical protein DFP72DRAFT_576416 [Tulosesus angulatus]